MRHDVLHAAVAGGALAVLLALGACGAAPRQTAGSGAVTPGGTPIETELKRTVRTDQIATARAVLGLDDSEAVRVAVCFYDTPALELFESGLVLRSRLAHGDDDDVTVKLRPLPPSAVAASWFDEDGFKCEEDRSGQQSVSSCSFTVSRSARSIDAVQHGTARIASLFSEEQCRFVREYATVQPDWERLEVLGPLDAETWEVELRGLEPELSAELWTLPDGRQMLEVSTKVPQAEADATAAALDAALAARGLDTSGAQETKTHAALQAFAERR
jgi:hypothetical protein